MLIHLFLFILILYILSTLLLTYVVHQIPRNPVTNPPDWGEVTDHRIPARQGGELEVWEIKPEGESKGIVLLAHGWSRNRDRMVSRARIFGEMGFTAIIHSARDHGNSSPYPFMNALRFAEDIESVISWINKPVILYGHSAGAAGAIISASRNPDKIKLLFLEGCYARTKEALRSLYRSYNIIFGIVFAPMVVFWMDIFYRFRLNKVNPVRLAAGIEIPVLIIHGEKDRSFPVHNAKTLKESFPPGKAELYIGKGSDHSSSSLTAEYPSVIQDFIRRHYK